MQLDEHIDQIAQMLAALRIFQMVVQPRPVTRAVPPQSAMQLPRIRREWSLNNGCGIGPKALLKDLPQL
jgi:hypothetical protein